MLYLGWMKRNLLALLVVAFAVAVISTGLFYGMIAGRLDATPATPPPGQTGGPAPPQTPPELRVPSGMRAVSVHVVDSSGVVALLRPGSRVDVQALRTETGRDPELKILLQNIEVLSGGPQSEAEQARPGPQTVTLLATPSDADALALADSTARLRLTLRNAKDDGRQPSRRLALTRLFESLSPAAPAPASARPAPARPKPRAVETKNPACVCPSGS